MILCECISDERLSILHGISSLEFVFIVFELGIVH